MNIQHPFSYSGSVTFDTLLESSVIQLTCSDNNSVMSQVKLAPDLGSNLFQFAVNGQELIYTDNALLKDRDWTGCFVLWPYPNRVRNKEYEFEGQHVSLKDIKRKRGNYPLIHGLVDDQVWKYEEPTVTNDNVSVKTSFTISSNSPLYRFFPYESSLTLQYILTKDSIRIEYTVRNNSKKNMPFGFALHPYFSTLSGLQKTLVTLPADTVMKADEELLPSGELQDVTGTPYDLRKLTPIKNLALDHVFTSLTNGEHATIEYPDQHIKLHLDASQDLTHLVLYTMEKDSGFICLENQSGSTDMHNLHDKALQKGDEALKRAAHLLILTPGNSHTGFIQYRIERIGN